MYPDIERGKDLWRSKQIYKNSTTSNMHLLGRLLLLQKPLEKLEQQLLWVEEEVHNLIFQKMWDIGPGSRSLISRDFQASWRSTAWEDIEVRDCNRRRNAATKPYRGVTGGQLDDFEEIASVIKTNNEFGESIRDEPWSEVRPLCIF